MLRLILAVALLFPAVIGKSGLDPVPFNVPADFVIENLTREIDLSVPALPFIQTTMSIKALKKGGGDFFVASPATDSLAEITAKVNDNPIPLVQRKFDAVNDVQLYSLKITSDTILTITEYLFPLVTPFPPEVKQGESQQFRLRRNVYYDSPYQVDKQKTIVKVDKSAASIIEYSKETSPASQSGPKVTFGPYNNAKPYSKTQMHVLIKDNSPFLMAKTRSVTYTITHWGANMAVFDEYDLVHAGPKLKGFFSRIEWMGSEGRSIKSSAVTHVMANIPMTATHLDYRDSIGNVSTSNVVTLQDQRFMVLQPRYPLYGGWKYSFYFAYNAPLKSFGSVDASTGVYSVLVPFASTIEGVGIKKNTVKIVLPEGATVKSVKYPFKVDSEQHTTTYTYLDTIGRPTIVLEKNNVVGAHRVPVVVEYELKLANLLLKPAACVAGILTLFILTMVSLRLDLSIVKKPKVKTN